MTNAWNKERLALTRDALPNGLHTGKPEVFRDSVDKHSNTLLRIIEQRPSKLPDQLQDGSLSTAQRSHVSQSRSMSTFSNRSTPSMIRKIAEKFRPQTDITYSPDPVITRRAYLFIPQVKQGLRETKIIYTIAELLLSQAEIAAALSDWGARKSGIREFNSWEPSQKEALDQIEAGRGTLFPTYFVMRSIQYTNPRTFSATTLSLRSKDIIVIVEEIQPPLAQSAGNLMPCQTSFSPAQRLSATKSEYLPRLKSRGDSGNPSRGSFEFNESSLSTSARAGQSVRRGYLPSPQNGKYRRTRSRLDYEGVEFFPQRLADHSSISPAVTKEAAEDFVDELVERFGIPLI